MVPEVLLKDYNLADALANLKKEVASNPADAGKRWFLFQLFCFNSEYERAQEQLKLAAQLDESFQSAFLIYSRVIASELFRNKVVVSGQETPLVLGEPEEWVAKLLEANRMLGQGNLEAATKLRMDAYDLQPVVSGKCNDVSFDWICDQDSRFAGNLECFLNGKYYWLSLSQVKELSLAVTTEKRTYIDLLYPRAKLVLRTEAELDVMLFARYPGNYLSESSELAMNRLTEWEDLNDYNILGRGQRMFCSDSSDFPILELSTLLFD
jgi:type VI secretion system protein ImpE